MKYRFGCHGLEPRYFDVAISRPIAVEFFLMIAIESKDQERLAVDKRQVERSDLVRLLNFVASLEVVPVHQPLALLVELRLPDNQHVCQQPVLCSALASSIVGSR